MEVGPFNWRRVAVRHLLMYSLDMAIAIAGWTYGFGLKVQSWPALVGLLIVSRFCTSTLWWAWTRRDALTSIDVDAQDVIYTRIMERLSASGWPGAYARADDLLKRGLISAREYRQMLGAGGAEGEEADPPPLEAGRFYRVCAGCHSVKMCVNAGKCMLGTANFVPGRDTASSAAS